MAETGNFSLINFDGKPVEKLIEVVSQAIGTLYRPISIRKEAKAKAFEIEVLEKAKSKALAESKFMDADTLHIIEQKFLHQQLKKQSNIDQIIDVAIDQVSQEEEISKEPIDSDWSTRFFNIAEDISNEEMQQLWGRILAGEVKTPGSFSLRSLDLLKNLTKEEAEIFTKFAELKVNSPQIDFIPYNDKLFLEKEFSIKYKDILLMSELGLLIHQTDLGIISQGTGKSYNELFKNGEMGIFVETSANNSRSNLKILSFTKIGSELSTLITFPPNAKYLNYICKALSTPFTEIKVGKFEIKDGNQILTNAVDFKA